MSTLQGKAILQLLRGVDAATREDVVAYLWPDFWVAALITHEEFSVGLLTGATETEAWFTIHDSGIEFKSVLEWLDRNEPGIDNMEQRKLLQSYREERSFAPTDINLYGLVVTLARMRGDRQASYAAVPVQTRVDPPNKDIYQRLALLDERAKDGIRVDLYNQMWICVAHNEDEIVVTFAYGVDPRSALIRAFHKEPRFIMMALDAFSLSDEIRAHLADIYTKYQESRLIFIDDDDISRLVETVLAANYFEVIVQNWHIRRTG